VDPELSNPTHPAQRAEALVRTQVCDEGRVAQAPNRVGTFIAAVSCDEWAFAQRANRIAFAAAVALFSHTRNDLVPYEPLLTPPVQ
jgi:hypothetical protein